MAIENLCDEILGGKSIWKILPGAAPQNRREAEASLRDKGYVIVTIEAGEVVKGSRYLACREAILKTRDTTEHTGFYDPDTDQAVMAFRSPLKAVTFRLVIEGPA